MDEYYTVCGGAECRKKGTPTSISRDTRDTGGQYPRRFGRGSDYRESSDTGSWTSSSIRFVGAALMVKKMLVKREKDQAELKCHDFRSAGNLQQAR